MFASVSKSIANLLNCKFTTFTRSPNKIIIAGRVDTIVFDKTGTLTELNMNLFETLGHDNPHFYKCMSSCHSLVLLNGTVQGDHLETELLKHSGYNMHEDLESI